VTAPSLNPEQAPPAGLSAPESRQDPVSGTERRPGGAFGPQTGAESFENAPEAADALCPSQINDGHGTVQCALQPHSPDEDHRHGFLAWDDSGHWYARRDFPNLYPTIGAQLRDLRDQCGLTQQQIAKTIGLTRSSIANIERGTQHLPLHNWVAICQTLGADPADVITRALQGVGPLAEPVPGKGDKRTAQLRRRLERAQTEIASLLAALETP
jgi:DNA-binding XRE family transcriptional regulator